MRNSLNVFYRSTDRKGDWADKLQTLKIPGQY